MRKFLLALILFSFSSVGYAVNCEVHKVYCKIVKLQPRIDKAKAMKLSNFIYKGAKAIGIDPLISVAILNQENRFRNVHTYEVESSIKEECHTSSCTRIVTEHQEVADMGIAQINIRTAIAYGFDLQRLYDHDIEYAIESHFIILKSKINMCKDLGNDSWSCYHSKTPEHRLKYVKMVSRYLK